MKISITFAICTDSQNPFRWRAHGSHNVASFAFPPKIGSTSFFATKHPMDVCTLAGRVMSQPISTPLQDGLRFFHHFSPYLPQHALRLACPRGQRHEVATFHIFDNGYLRSTLSAGGNLARVGRLQITSEPPTYLFGSSLTAPLACQFSRQLQVFTSVDHSILS